MLIAQQFFLFVINILIFLFDNNGEISIKKKYLLVESTSFS